MLYPLYEYYSHSNFNLYEVRNHYLEHFYYKKHSRGEADKVLKSIVRSSKIDRLIQESANGKVVPICENFINVICSMFKFMFKSNETIALATLDAALRWDIEVNKELQLITSEKFKQDILFVFKKFDIYEEMEDKEFHAVVDVPTVDAEIVEEPKKKMLLEHKKNQTTWTFLSFAKEFGEDVSVGKFHRRDDGEPFYSCIFTDEDGYKTFVGFSSKLGVLTADEISMMKDKLIVIKSPSGNYNLYKANGNFWKKVRI